MAPILPPPISAAQTEPLTSHFVKKKTLITKKKSKKAPSLNDSITTKPLPQLIQEVLKAMDEEEENLRKEEEELLKEREAIRLNKPPAIPPQNLSPLNDSHPPLPPPKDVEKEHVEKILPSLKEKEKEEIKEEQEEQEEQEEERLSLEEDYPNRTIDAKETISIEYRNRMNIQENQWYFDEYSGLYRQNVSLLHQSLPNFQKMNTPLIKKNGNSSSMKRSKSTVTKNRPSSFLLKLKLSQCDDTESVCSNISSSSSSRKKNQINWPTPTSVEQVHSLRKKASSMRDRRKKLDLCRTLMDAACHGETTVYINKSPIPGTPLVNTRYKQQDLRKKKKEDLILDEVLVLEAQKILKKLAIGSVGHNTNDDAQFLLANCYGMGGLGLTLSREKAFSLYIHASKQNHIESTYRAAVCYEIGIGTRKDYTRAMVYYRKAANQSHVASMYKLAVILLRGFCGQVVNTREAITWLQRAIALANTQNPHALYVLAMFQFTKEFADDPALIPDPSYALELLHESAQLNYIPSQVKLGELYQIGDTVDVDDALSIYWYTKAAKQGNADAALALSSWYLTGSSGILAQSDREAYLWARKAASSQNADRWTIAKAYFLVGVYVDRGIGISHASTKEAKIWFKRSAALGHKGAVEMIDKNHALPGSTVFTVINN